MDFPRFAFIGVHLCASVDSHCLFFISTENMRIKIIGENNCARATRHLLRLAGFAVTEFLPAEVVTQAPHLGFAITIETAASASGIAPGAEGGGAPSIARKFSEGVTSISRAPRPSPGEASTAQTSDSWAASTAQTSNSWAASTAQTSNSWAASTAHTRLAPAAQPLNSADASESGSFGGLAHLTAGFVHARPTCDPRGGVVIRWRRFLSRLFFGGGEFGKREG